LDGNNIVSQTGAVDNGRALTGPGNGKLAEIVDVNDFMTGSGGYLDDVAVTGAVYGSLDTIARIHHYGRRPRPTAAAKQQQRCQQHYFPSLLC